MEKGFWNWDIGDGAPSKRLEDLSPENQAIVQAKLDEKRSKRALLAYQKFDRECREQRISMADKEKPKEEKTAGNRSENSPGRTERAPSPHQMEQEQQKKDKAANEPQKIDADPLPDGPGPGPANREVVSDDE